MKSIVHVPGAMIASERRHRYGRNYGKCHFTVVRSVEHKHEAETTENVPQSNVWELDFCSRPLLDERGKKVWELLICDPQKSFVYSQYFPNNKINSGEVGVFEFCKILDCIISGVV